MSVKQWVVGVIVASAMGSLCTPVFAGECKTSSAQGWGLTEEMAKWQANDMLLLSTGNLPVQNDRFSKPSHKCSLTLLGWSCKATAKICKK